MKTKTTAEASKKKSVLSTIFLIFECFISIICIALSIYVLVNPSQVSDDGKAKASLMPVLTDSMEPTIKTNSLVFAKEVPDGILDLNTIVTFVVYSPQGNYLNTHRIVAYQCRNSYGGTVQVYCKVGEMETAAQLAEKYPNYTITGYITRGDKYTVAYGDETLTDFSASKSNNILVTTYNDEPLFTDEVVALYDKHIEGIGGVLIWLQDSTHFLLVIMVPLFLLLAYNVYDLIKNIMNNKIAKATASVSTAALSEEEIKRKAIEEYLASQNLANTSPTTEATTNSESATSTENVATNAVENTEKVEEKTEEKVETVATDETKAETPAGATTETSAESTTENPSTVEEKKD